MTTRNRFREWCKILPRHIFDGIYHNKCHTLRCGRSHQIFVVARSCIILEIYFEWSQCLRHINIVWRWGQYRNKYMSWWYRGCVASQSCGSRRTILSYRALSGGWIVVHVIRSWSTRGMRVRQSCDCRKHNSLAQLLGRSRIHHPTIYRETVSRLSTTDSRYPRDKYSTSIVERKRCMSIVALRRHVNVTMLNIS